MIVLPTSVLDPNIITGDTFDTDDGIELNDNDFLDDINLLFLNLNIFNIKI